MMVSVSRWVCPACDREFDRSHQSHVCVPGCTLDETFAGRPPVQREIYDSIQDFLESLGPVHLDVVSVGVFLKVERKLGEIRPMARALSVAFVLPRTVHDARITRTFGAGGDRVWHVMRLTDPSQVDDQVRDWLTEAYDAAR
jgi:hypothetical protein